MNGTLLSLQKIEFKIAMRLNTSVLSSSPSYCAAIGTFGRRVATATLRKTVPLEFGAQSLRLDPSL